MSPWFVDLDAFVVSTEALEAFCGYSGTLLCGEFIYGTRGLGGDQGFLSVWEGWC